MRRAIFTRVSACISVFGLISVAMAQEGAPPSNSSEPPVDEVVVTGSRIRQDAQNLANPVTSFTVESLVNSGKTDVADFLAQSPALLGSITGDLTAGSNPGFGAVGLNLLDLRHLGVDRTLVLVDGRRHVAGLEGSAAVDIDSIPDDLIESIDVLTGGASAVYGADGVSGVVNFRLKKNIEGLSFRGQASRSSRGDGDNYHGAVTGGTNFAQDRGNLAFAYEYDRDVRVFDQDRSYLRPKNRYGLLQNQDDLDDDPNVPDNVPYNDIRYADSAPNSAVDVDFDFVPDYEGGGNLYDRGFLLENSGGFTSGGSSSAVDGYQGDLFPESERHLVNLLGHFDVSDSLTLTAEAKYGRNRAFSYAQPSYDFYVFIQDDNPYLPQTIRDAIVPGAAADALGDPSIPDGVLITRDNFDLGTNGEDTTRETLRGVLAANGTVNDHLSYEVSYVYGETRSRIVEQNNRFEDRWAAAIDVTTQNGVAICRALLDPDHDAHLDGCVPYNIFGNGVRNQEAADWVNIDSVSHTKVTQQVVSGSLSGDFGDLLKLPGGSIGYAFGAEYRRESSESRPAEELQEDGLTWWGLVTPSNGSFDVKELFTEINLPVLSDARFAHRLSFGAAFRASDYSTVGKTNSWKVDAVYAPVSSISFRGTYAQAVRAPNISELFTPESQTFNFITDPCDINETNNGSSTREANCAELLEGLGIDPTTFTPSNTPQATLFTEGRFGGNLALKEETATTWTAGVVFRPEFARSLSLSFDWYDIEIEDAINTPTANELVELCVDQPTIANPFCAGVDRDPDTGYIVGFRVGPDNVAQFSTAGMDVSLDWNLTTDSHGEFSVQLAGGYLDRLEFISSPGAQVDNDLGEDYFPRFAATLDATWKHGPLRLSYGLNWSGHTDRYNRETLAGDPDYADPRFFTVKEKWDHEIGAAYDVTEQINIYGGINNLLDQKPAFNYSSYPISAMGRYFYVGARMNMAGK